MILSLEYHAKASLLFFICVQANGFGAELFALRPDGAVAYVEWEQTKNYAQMQKPKIIQQVRNAQFPEQDISDRTDKR